MAGLFQSGADAPLSFGFNTAGTPPALTSGGVALSYTIAANLITGTAGGQTVFTMALDAATGAWTFTLLRPLDHPTLDGVAGDNTENDLTIDFGGLVQATDFDGDTVTATGAVTVTVDDDTPTASLEPPRTIPEGTTVTGTLDFEGGADGASVTHINGTLLVFGADGYSQELDIGPASLQVKADGSYVFIARTPTLGFEFATATFTVTDGDGDTAMSRLVFGVTDANFPTPGAAVAAVDDDGLSGGNPASIIGDLNANAGDAPADTSEATFTGVLGGSIGGDGPGANGFAFAPSLNGTKDTVGLETVTYSVVGNVLTATGPRGALFRVEITDQATGAYTVTLLDNVLHADGPNDEATDAVVTLGYVITDADGSTGHRQHPDHHLRRRRADGVGEPAGAARRRCAAGRQRRRRWRR